MPESMYAWMFKVCTCDAGQICPFFHNKPATKVIYPKYSKHWTYTVAHTIDCGCSKMISHGLNHELFLSLLRCPIYWIVYVLTSLNIIF